MWQGRNLRDTLPALGSGHRRPSPSGPVGLAAYLAPRCQAAPRPPDSSRTVDSISRVESHGRDVRDTQGLAPLSRGCEHY